MAEENIKLPQPDYDLSQRISQERVDINPIDTSMPYQKITDLIPDMSNEVSEEYDRSIQLYKGLFDTISPVTYANEMIGSQASVMNTVPSRTNLTPKEKLKELFNEPLRPNTDLPQPTWTNSKLTNFDKIYASDAFSDIGFTPYANMDTILNANETRLDAATRFGTNFQKMFRSGRFANYRSFADMFTGDYLDSPDLEGARTMEDSMRIGGSTTGSATGFLANTGLNFAYSAGIIYQIALEEVVAAGLAAAGTIPSGGTSWAAFGATTLKNLKSAFQLPRTIAQGFKASYNLAMGLNKLDFARDFYNTVKAGGQFVGKVFMPSTTAHAIKNWKTTGNTFQNLYNLGRQGETFGSFYRDLRMYNAAIAEAKMEAGLVYNRVLEDGMRRVNAQNGGAGLTPDDMANISAKASEASWKTFVPNALLIGVSNRIVFKNVFGGWAKQLNKGTARQLKRVMQIGPRQYAKKSKWLLKSIPQEINAAFKMAGFKGAIKTSAGVMLRAGTKGIAEGFQELGQETVSAATQGYYASLLGSPLSGGSDTLTGYYGDAAKEMFSKQGAEIFASGFLIGGLSGVYQTVLFDGVPAIYSTVKSKLSQNKKFSPLFDGEVQDLAKQQRQQEEQMIDNIVSQANELGLQMDQLELMLDPNRLQAIAQDQSNGVTNMSIALNDSYDYFNNRNFAQFYNIYNKYQKGTMGFYKNMLQDMVNMSDQEIAEAFTKKDFGRTPQEIKAEITKELQRVNKFGDRVADKNMQLLFEDKKVDLSTLEKDSKEYIDARFKNRAVDDAMMLYIFAKESFDNALERQMKIEKSFEDSPLYNSQKYGDVRVLANAESIATELSILEKEIKVREDAGVPAKELKADKTKYKNLKRYYDILTDPENLTKKGFFNRAKTKKIKAALKAYINGLAVEPGDYVSDIAVEDLLTKLVDHNALQEDAFAFSQAANIIANPEQMDVLVERTEDYFRFLFKNRDAVRRLQVENYLNAEKKNELINQIADLDVYMSPELARSFLADEISADGLLQGLKEGMFSIDGRALGGPGGGLTVDQELTNTITSLINTYKLTIETEVINEQIIADVADNEVLEVEDKLQDAGVGAINIGDTNRSDFLQSVLQREYRKYKETAASDALSYADWRNSTDGVKIKTAFDSLKRIWASGFDIFVQENGQTVTRKRVPTEKEILSEQGFQDFLDSKEGRENVVVNDVLGELNMTIDMFTSKPAETVTPKNIVAEGVNFDVIEVEVGEDSFYKIVNKQGQDLTENELSVVSDENQAFGSYSSLSKAKRDLDILDRELTGGSIFAFDGLALSKGISVYDIDTEEEYRVNSLNNNGFVMLVPAEFYSDYKTRVKNQKPYSELDFSKKFTLEKLTYTALPSNASKLFSNRLNRAYAATNIGESSEAARDRLQYIVSALSAEDFSKVIVSFEENPRFEEEMDDNRFNVGDNTVPNPYLRKQRERYTIALRLPSALTVQLNQQLQQRGFNVIEGANINAEGEARFAFLPNDSIYFEDLNGSVIDPANMTTDFARQVILPANTEQGISAALLEVNDGLSKQAALVSIANDKLESNETVGTLGQGVTIKRYEGVPAYRKDTNPEIPLGDVIYRANTNGDILIYDIDRDGEGNMIGEPKIITNLKGKENKIAREKLKSEIKQKLENSGLWDKMASGERSGPLAGYTDRYIMPVVSDGGLVTLVTAKAAYIGDEQLTSMMDALLQQASLALKDNTVIKKVKGTNRRVIKNKDFNDEFKKDFEEKYGKFFISTPTGGNRIDIDVAPDGAIRADIFSGATGKRTKVFYNSSEQQKENTPLGHLQQLFNKIINDQDVVKIESLSKNNFRVSVPLESTADQLLDLLVTKIAPNVRDGQYISFDASSSAIAAAKSKGIILGLPRKNLETIEKESPKTVQDPARQRAEAISNLGDKITQENLEEAVTNLEQNGDVIPDDVFTNFTNSDVVEETVLQSIAEKIMTGQQLSVRESAIYGSKKHAARIEQILQNSVSAEKQQQIELTQLGATPLDIVNAEIAEREAEIVAEVGEKGKIKALRKDTVYQNLLKQREKLIGPANKILSPNLSTRDVEDINVFADWASANLPEFISVSDISVLGNNLKAGGVRVGAFAMDLASIAGGLRTGGVIYTGAANPFRYHEAFHGVYRMLLTNEEQAQLRSVARKEVRAKLRAEGKSFNTEIQKFKNSAEQYSNLSRQELENLFYEEYMADQFEIFKTAPTKTKTDSVIKSFFTKIIEWFKNLFNKYHKTELQTLFEKIDSGKFANASVVANDFTLDQSPKTLIANAILPYQSLDINGQKGYLYLDSEIANNLVSSLAADYVSRKNDNSDPEVTNNDLFEEALEDFAWLYNPKNNINDKFNGDEPSNILAREQLVRIHDALVFNATADITESPIYKEVFDLLEIIDVQQQIEQDEVDAYENSEGLRNVTQFGKEAYMSGGLASLPTYLRQYLSTITMPFEDIFGNKQLDNGRPLLVNVDSYKIYNGITKAVKNLTDPLKIMQAMYLFSKNNPNTRAAVERIFNDIGLNYYDVSDITDIQLPQEIKNPLLFNQITKGFTNYKVDWMFVQQDNTNEVISFSAAQRDDVNTQTELWSQAYTTKSIAWKINPSLKSDALDSLDEISDALNEGNTYGTDTALTDQAISLANDLYNTVGIKLSPLYIEYSILSNVSSNRSAVQQMLMNFNKEAVPVTGEDFYYIRKIINSDADLYNSEDKGAVSRLKKLAVNNAIFDETIGLSVFKNINGDLVNAHQKPTFHLERMFSLNSLSEIDRLQKDPFIKNNPLLESDDFLDMSSNRMLKIQRLSGLKELSTMDKDVAYDSAFGNILDTTTYGSLSPKQFVDIIINNYFFDYNGRSKTLGSKTDYAIAPSLIRVLESSDTGDLTSLPVVKAVEGANYKITEDYIDKISTFVENEYNRIVRENDPQASAVPLQTVTTKDGETVEIPKQIPGYNIPDSDGVMRKDLMFNTKDLITPEVKDILEVSAKQTDPPTFEKALSESGISKKKYRKMLSDQLDAKFERFKQVLERVGAQDRLSKYVTDGLVKGETDPVAKSKATEAAKKLNIKADQEYNLKQIYLSDYINTKSINEILLGDQALILEDSIKQIKRAKGQNAAGDSIYSPVANPRFGVMESTENINANILLEPTIVSEFSGRDIDRADAQVYVTTKFHRHAQNSLGILNEQGARAIDKLEDGDVLTGTEVFGDNGMVNTGQMLNSKKYVYFDGQSYVKFSAITLTNGLVKNNPRLQQLKDDLEAQEKEYGNISMAGPESAFKMLKTNIQVLGEEINEPSIILDARYFREQVKNPSNKDKITDQTQMSVLLTSEQSDSTPVSIAGRPEIKTVADVRREYNKALSRRIILKYKNKRNLIYSIDGLMEEFSVSKRRGSITPNLRTFLDYARNSLKASKASTNLMEFFTVDETTGEIRFNINNPISAPKAEQLFLSYFSKDVFQQKVPGHGLALLSDEGNTVVRRIYNLDEDGKIGRNEIIRDPQGDETIFDVIPNSNDQIPKEGILVRDRLRYQLKEYNDKGEWTGLYYTEMMMPAHTRDVYNKIQLRKGESIPAAIANMYAVRIPSQDKHSSMFVKLVDFLPVELGSTAMLPAELVEVAGSDFDIDKIYAQIKDFYYDVDQKQFFAYGETKGREYSDYVRYLNDAVNKDTIYRTAFKSFRDQGLNIEDSFTDAELIDSDFSDRAIKAAARLGLPITPDKYKEYVSKYGEPYEGALNNQVLDYKTALMGNAGIKDIAVTPATLTAIENAYTELSQVAPDYVKQLDNENIDVDTIDGKLISFEVNKGAAIGKAVSPNLYLSLLSEYAIQLPSNLQFTIDKTVYTGYDNYTNNYGDRKQDEISSIITMLTDNSKENYVAKLGMHPTAVGYATNLVALGVPLTEVVLFLNSKPVREIFETVANSVNNAEVSVKQAIKNKARELFGEEGLKKQGASLNRDILLKGVEKKLTKEEIGSILSVLEITRNISGFTSSMQSFTGLASKGMGSSFVDMERTLQNIKELESEEAGVDISPILKDSWLRSSIDVYKQITEDLIPATFIRGTDNFIDFYDEVSATLNTDFKTFGPEQAQKVKRDMLSYLTIRAYMNNEATNKENATLTNDLIYPNDTDFSIYKAISRLTQADPQNFFLNNFITEVPVFNENNRTGLNLIQANTWRGLNKKQKLDLQTSFAKLYGNPVTRRDAMTIVNYLMVKDGLQSSKGTLLDAISPFVITNYLETINNVQEAFLTGQGFEETFGDTKDAVIEDFIVGYFSSASSQSKVFRVDYDGIGYFNGSLRLKIKITDGNLTFTKEETGDSDIIMPRYLMLNDVIQNQSQLYRLKDSTEVEDSVSSTYEPTVAFGSYYQNGIGFMFGDRISVLDNQKNIKNRGTFKSMYAEQEFNEYEYADVENFAPRPTPQNKALANENATIEATEDEINFTAEDTQGAINIADVSALDKILGQETQAEDNVELEAEGVEVAEESQPEISMEQGEQLSLFMEDKSDQYPAISEFYDNIVSARPGEIGLLQQDLEILQENGLDTLEGMIAFYESPQQKFDSEEDFIDYIKNCLGLA